MNPQQACKISVPMPALRALHRAALPNDGLRSFGCDDACAATASGLPSIDQDRPVYSAPCHISSPFDGAMQQPLQLQSP